MQSVGKGGKERAERQTPGEQAMVANERAGCDTFTREEGYALTVVSSLEEVPTQFDGETFALVLADVFVGRAPAGSFTPAHQLRRLVYPTPVSLLMTLPWSPEEAERAGFAFVLPMPFDLEDLLAQVATTLQRSLSEEDHQRIRVVERYFAALEREDWQAMLDLCTEDVAFYPLASSPRRTVRQMQGQAAVVELSLLGSAVHALSDLPALLLHAAEGIGRALSPPVDDAGRGAAARSHARLLPFPGGAVVPIRETPAVPLCRRSCSRAPSRPRPTDEIARVAQDHLSARICQAPASPTACSRLSRAPRQGRLEAPLQPSERARC